MVLLNRIVSLPTYTVLHEKYGSKGTAPKVSKGRRFASGESAEGGSRRRSNDDRKALWGARLSSPVATKRKPSESVETSGPGPRRLRLRMRPQARNLGRQTSNCFMREQYEQGAGSASCIPQNRPHKKALKQSASGPSSWLNQYALAKYITFLAFLPQHTQVSPKVSPSWSKGMLREEALN